MITRHPIDIPEIAEAIDRYLLHQDRVNCLRVSKVFYSAFIHYVWRKITVEPQEEESGRISHPTGASLERNKHLIQELCFDGEHPDEYLSLQGCSRLQGLDISPVKDIFESQNPDSEDFTERVFPGLVILIERHSSSIRSIALYRQGRITSVPQEFWTTISRCSNLSRLHLDSISIPLENWPAFLQVCAKPTFLSLTQLLIPELPCNLYDQEGKYARDPSELFFPGVRHLELCNVAWRDGRLCLSAEVQAMIARGCPNLESLSWSEQDRFVSIWFRIILSRNEQGTAFCRGLSKQPWVLPLFDSLDLASGTMDDESMANLIGQMLQLKVLKASDTQFGPLTFQAMQRDSLYQYRRVSFFESIQDLQIHQCPCVTSSMIQTILESCPNLIKLSADKVTAMDIIRGREWACVGIRELSIYLQVSNDNENLGRKDFSNEDLEVHRFVYSRLAMLTRLQKLTLTQKEGFAYYIYKRTLQLRLEAGLELLSGLKDLQSIVFSEDPHQTMRVDEAIWITENWPELRKFAGRPNDDEEICEKIKDVLETKQILVGDRELDTD